MKTGIELIVEERQKQIEKHGRTVEMDVKINTAYQLAQAARSLAKFCINEEFTVRPIGWDRLIWRQMIGKSYKERLIIAGALIAAEIDRLQNNQL